MSAASSLWLATLGIAFGSCGRRFPLEPLLIAFHALRSHGQLDYFAVVIHPKIEADLLTLWRGAVHLEMIQVDSFVDELHRFLAFEDHAGHHFGLANHVNGKLLRVLIFHL